MSSTSLMAASEVRTFATAASPGPTSVFSELTAAPTPCRDSGSFVRATTGSSALFLKGFPPAPPSGLRLPTLAEAVYLAKNYDVPGVENDGSGRFWASEFWRAPDGSGGVEHEGLEITETEPKGSLAASAALDTVRLP